MQSFEVTINAETYRIVPGTPDSRSFSLFNHSTCHVIKKNEAGIWYDIQHRFGKDEIPLQEIGAAIDRYYNT